MAWMRGKWLKDLWVDLKCLFWTILNKMMG